MTFFSFLNHGPILAQSLLEMTIAHTTLSV
jgi:hypothetical protein